jgi:DNA repair protein RecN (Recombination protein N)
VADSDRIPVLIFDEIDIGISGRIAQSVGRNLRQLAASHQVLCITHLPQIASMAHHHYLVEKSVTDGRTRTSIRLLTEDERTEQVARLFGGEIVTETHLSSARELIAEARASH